MLRKPSDLAVVYYCTDDVVYHPITVVGVQYTKCQYYSEVMYVVLEPISCTCHTLRCVCKWVPEPATILDCQVGDATDG